MSQKHYHKIIKNKAMFVITRMFRRFKGYTKVEWIRGVHKKFLS